VFFPRALSYPLSVLIAWIAFSLMYRGYKLHYAQDWLEGNEQLAEGAATTDQDDYNPANPPRISTDQEAS